MGGGDLCQGGLPLPDGQRAEIPSLCGAEPSLDKLDHCLGSLGAGDDLEAPGFARTLERIVRIRVRVGEIRRIGA